MSIFVFLNWLACISTFMLLVLIIWRYRYLIIKPSIILIVFFHIQIQWAATAQAAFIEQYLPRPFDFFLLAQIFPFLGLMVSFFILHKNTKNLYLNIRQANMWTLEIKARNIIVLFGLIFLIVLIYLFFVPLAHTGFYTILVDPLESTQARETSLKLLDNTFLRYGFSFLKSTLAPLLSVLIVVFMIQSIKKKKILHCLWATFIFLFILIAVMLPGARMPGALLMLTVLFAIFLINKLPVRPLYILLGFLLIIMLPVLMTIFREGQDLSFFMFFDYLKGGIFQRTFVVPMETGLWHVHYAQELGFVGYSGIPKLAQFMNVDPINLSNIIYLKYSPYHLYSGFSNTCFVFAYYTCFGIGSLALSLIGLWMLDLAVLVYNKLKNRAILVAAIASIVTSSFAFASTMYTTALITNGFIFILVMALIMDRLSDFYLVDEKRLTGKCL